MNKCSYKKKRPIIGRQTRDAIPGDVQHKDKQSILKNKSRNLTGSCQPKP